jgi:prevent-host-death family protein
MSVLIPTIVPISEAKPRLAALVDMSEEKDVILTRRGRAAAVLVSVERYNDLLDRLEDLEDSLAVEQTRGEPTVPAEEVFAKLGTVPLAA